MKDRPINQPTDETDGSYTFNKCSDVQWTYRYVADDVTT